MKKTMKIIYTWADDDGYSAVCHIEYCCDPAKEAVNNLFMEIEMSDRWGARCLIHQQDGEEWRKINYCPFCGAKIMKEEDTLLNSEVRKLKDAMRNINELHNIDKMREKYKLIRKGGK